MDNVVAAIKITHPSLMQSPDVDLVSNFGTLKENGERLINAIVNSKGGRVVGDYEGITLVEIPIENVEALKEIKKRMLDEAGIRYSAIGVGETVDDAMLAMKNASKDFSIKVFKPEMVEDEHPVDSPSVATGEETQPVRKAEISPDAQKMIGTLVNKITQHKEYVESLKQSNPTAYASVVEVMQALAAMVSHVKDTNTRKAHEDERERLDKVVNSVHDGKFDHEERAILHEILQTMKPKSHVIAKAEGDTADIIGKLVLKLHSQIPHFEKIRNENPEVFGTFVKMTRLLQALHEDYKGLDTTNPQSLPMGKEHAPDATNPSDEHIPKPPKEEKLTHPLPHYAPGSVRQYDPQDARQKTSEGDWVSVAGGTKRSQ